MKLTKRQFFYTICGVMVITCIAVNVNRQNKWMEFERIESYYKSVYGMERKQELTALKYMYDELVDEIKDYSKSDSWREERLEELCDLLGFNYGYHGQSFMIDDFHKYNSKYRDEDERIMIEIAEREAKAAEQKARDNRQFEQ